MRRAALWLAFLALVCGAPARASAPTVWEHPPHRAWAAPAPFERDGQRAEGVSIGETGALTLSAPLREIYPAGTKETAAPIFWTAALDPGGNLFVGAGGTGEVIRIDRKGTPTGKFETDEMGIRALAANAGGELFVATFPSGGVYRIKPSGQVDPWFDPETRYIWAMAMNKSGDIFLGTGERGIVYAVTGQSQGKSIYDSDEAHVTALAFDASGFLIAGTAPSGLLYRVGADGRAQTLLDSGLDEISAVTVTPDGVIYAAAMGEEPPPPVRRPGEKSDLTIEVTPAPDGSILEEDAGQPRKITIDLADLVAVRPTGGEGVAGRVYRLEPGREPALLWKSDTERVFSLAWTPERGLLFGATGLTAEGRIYRIGQDGSIRMLHQLHESQITSMLAGPDGRVYVCTSNPGRVYLLDTGSTSSGSYASSVYDAGHLARWGSVKWDADVPPGTRVDIATRSGNRPAPDSSWSDWSAPYALETGSAVASPPGRYLQWKAEMSRLKTEAAPVLRRVKVSLLPDNRPPVLRALRVLEAGAPVVRQPAVERALDKITPDKAPPEKTEPPKGSRWVTWNSSDPDDDPIGHTISVRRAGETAFRKVAENVVSSPYALADGELAEGSYVLAVEADDARANGSQSALSDAETSDPFVVDHTPPKLEVKRPGGAPGRLRAEVAAVDAIGTIARGEYSVDGGAVFNLLPCGDGICDTSAESFPIDLPEPGPGRKVIVKIHDASGNTALVEIP